MAEIRHGEDPQVRQIADAIAIAEGYTEVPESAAHRNNNPGNLQEDITHTASDHDGPYMVYPDIDTGIYALYEFAEMILDGAAVTPLELAKQHTLRDPDIWAAVVAKHLGVTPDSKISRQSAPAPTEHTPSGHSGHSGHSKHST